MELSGRTVLITGGSRGIGAATARLLGAEGAKVAVNYFQSEAKAEKVVADIGDAGGVAVAYRADVRERGEVCGDGARGRRSVAGAACHG